MKRIPIFVALVSFFIGGQLFAEDTTCPVGVKDISVANLAEITSALTEKNFGDGSTYLVDGKYKICFKSVAATPIETNQTILIAGKDKPFEVYGLWLIKGTVGFGKKFEGPLLSVSGSGIILHNITISDATTGIQILDGAKDIIL